MNCIYLVEIGSLKVYTYGRSHLPQGDIYWMDAKDPLGFGPFRSIMECLQHWQQVRDERWRIEATAPGTVVWVDFNTKTKIKNDDLP